MSSSYPDRAIPAAGNLKLRYQLIYELWKLYVRRYMAEERVEPEAAMARASAELARRGLLQAKG